MGYKAVFYGAAALLVLATGMAVSFDLWNDKLFWDEANKYGVFLTAFSTMFSIVTFLYLGMYGEKLKKRHRIPETHKSLQELLLEVRHGLKDWKGRENDIIDVLHQIGGHLNNVSQKLDGPEKKLAKKIAAEIARDGYVYVFRRALTQDASVLSQIKRSL